MEWVVEKINNLVGMGVVQAQVYRHLHCQKMEQGLVDVLVLGQKDWEQEVQLIWVYQGMKTH